MTKTCFLLFALLVLAATVCSPVLAATYNVPLDLDKWGYDPDGVCTFEREAAWWMALDGADVEVLLPLSPEGDPRIRQQIVNQSADIWTDWHAVLVNASNLRGIFVWKIGELTPWVIDPPMGGGMGFFAHVVTGQSAMAVNPGETLFVEFTYDAIPGPVTVTQYPTTWYPVPEPASIMALVMGMGAFGFGAIRRIKK